MRHDSENEDEPEPYQSSGDEWNENSDISESYTRRKSKRLLSKKPKTDIIEITDDDDDEDNDDIDKDERLELNFNIKVDDSIEKQIKKRPGRPAGTKNKRMSNSGDDKKPIQIKRLKFNTDITNEKRVAVSPLSKKFIPKTIRCTQFTSGSFVVTKKDLLENDKKQMATVWRIDGKALLQKFESFKKDDKILHQSTPVFAGWSPIEQHLYLPLTVDLIGYEGKKLIISVHWDKVSADTTDSE